MKACGIITEYNPLHNGHIHHIKEARRISGCDVLIAVMSGNFVQRGEPAICDKWTRAKEAIAQGCDLIIELPLPYAIQSAQQFAYGAVETLKLAQVEDLVFGSETNDLGVLQKIAALDSDGFRDLMKEGLSPVKAYEMIFGRFYANDILGIHYLKALQGSTITPHTIKRIGNYHDNTLTAAQKQIVSATALRTALVNKEDISAFSPMQITPHPSLEAYYPLIRYLLLSMPASSLNTYALMDEGIEAWLCKQAKEHAKWDTFLSACICKRYTASRIKRTLLHLLLQMQRGSYPIDHLRVLAFNAKGKAWLKQLKDKTAIAVKFAQLPVAYRRLYEKSAYLYAYPEVVANDSVKKEWQSAQFLTNE